MIFYSLEIGNSTLMLKVEEIDERPKINVCLVVQNEWSRRYLKPRPSDLSDNLMRIRRSTTELRPHTPRTS